ncbi:diguanylate cyclase [Rhodoferax sp.]|uniref:GGDEF domain-containing protein n=1 Tax=Rhodoferax sp. TaxID=50421 RepID=UPI00271E448B|nr:GGDEF domain-containing protein [Rhodoferax sp.]MDO9199592.1 GGDEF domain-containing protein [Rhodoferax sp.]
MENIVQELPGGDSDALLEEARARLREGDAVACQALAKSVLGAARAQQDVHLEARALLCLANGDRMVSHFRRANESSQRAATLFQLVGDVSGESEALTTVSYTFSVLGRNEEAVESALLSRHLSGLLPAGPALALSCNYLGVAYAHGCSFDRADEAFTTAIQILERQGLHSDAVLPWLNQCHAEVFRLFCQRYYTGQLPDLERLHALRTVHNPQQDANPSARILQGAYVISQALWALLSGIENCWRGQLEEAQTDVEMCAAWVARHPWNHSLTLLELWLRAEIAWARKDWISAEQRTRKMIEMAVEAEHEPMVALGHLLASQILAEQGHDKQSGDELKALRLREQSLHVEALKSREKVVAWQLKVRKNHEDLQRMEVTSKTLEKLSFEDPLTGLANRRRFMEIAPDMLSQGLALGRPLFVALIDIDQFKRVNDRFSHQVGDQVLQCIAQILKSHLREGDMPARLAGDEFVLAFGHADALDAAQVCERIRAAVKDFDWASIQNGLQVTISVGFAQAQAGDSIERLTHRADLAMYSEKQDAG